jgi:hypothetical protein
MGSKPPPPPQPSVSFKLVLLGDGTAISLSLPIPRTLLPPFSTPFSAEFPILQFGVGVRKKIATESG